MVFFKNSFLKIVEGYNQKRYRKYISSFVSPINNDKRIGQGITGLQEFDLIDSVGINELDGRSSKRFVMLNSDYFRDYFIASARKNNYYQSYLNDEDITKGVIPENISVLLKKQCNKRANNAEIVSSRILDYFGVNVVYNISLTDEENKTYLVSIDFIKPNEEFFTFFDFDCNCNMKFNKGSHLDEVDLTARNVLDKISKSKFLFLSQNEKNEIIEELIYSVFIRKFILGDDDARSGNFGLLFNAKTRSLRLAPNFDFNWTFQRHIYSKKSIEHLYNNYRHIYNKFIEKFNSFVSQSPYGGGDYQKIIYDNVNDKNIADDFSLKIQGSAMGIRMALKELNLEQEKSSFQKEG